MKNDRLQATVAKVNAELKRRGFKERLRRGKGYYYFYDGDASSWPSSSVYTNNIEAFTVDGWIEERKRLSEQ